MAAAGRPLPDAPARRRRKEARPQELLAAALALFAEKGFAATRAEEVAARAGVSKGTLYLYYPSKEELLKAVIRENLSQLIAEGQGLVETAQCSTAELLLLLMHTWWDRVGNTPAAAIHKIILSEVRNFPDIGEFYGREVIVPAEHLLMTAVQRGIDRGEFRPVPVREVALGLLAPVIFLSLHQHSLGACGARIRTLDTRSVLSAHIDLVLRGLQRRGDPLDDAPPLQVPTC
ncbi:transcriptional regulator, TetR family [Piscinibacter sakaiensis]|uniref:Transcriptional regulator, TetR family n=1 Tax=Piscinibacter sakaiensis TaxID=1547922 RepID=A0A0K8NYD8_PISS1|nr:transcriptional regulator, TetR family [Piscinibacter sakaiensis]